MEENTNETQNGGTTNCSDNSRPWYARGGSSSDVFLSSRVRLARNLANFPFPERFKNDDASHVEAILLDAFNKAMNSIGDDNFHSIAISGLSPENRLVLEERGVIKTLNEIRERKLPLGTQAIMNSEGDLSAVINGTDHLHIASYASALNFKEAYKKAFELDEKLQEHVQFAASYEFGYLSAAMKNLGSGIKFSAWVNIQMTLRAGKYPELLNKVRESGAELYPAFPYLLTNGNSPAGAIFNVFSTRSLSGSEVSQLADMEATGTLIAEYERKISEEYADNHITIIVSSVLRSLYIAKKSLLVTLREAIDIISDIQIGLRLGLVSGIDYGTLSSLLYRIQPGHIAYVMEEGNFDFGEDIKKDKRLMVDRLRAIVLQEAFENISLRKL